MTTTAVNHNITTVTETSTLNLPKVQKEDGAKDNVKDNIKDKVKVKVGMMDTERKDDYCTISSTRKPKNKRINWSKSCNWSMLKQAIDCEEWGNKRKKAYVMSYTTNMMKMR
eukprot:13757190-Ditylum_brightwellii.AAC.1